MMHRGRPHRRPHTRSTGGLLTSDHIGDRIRPGGSALRATTVLLAALIVLSGGAIPLVGSAQSDAEQPGTTLTIDAVGTAGVSGLAILTARDGGTAANVLAVGAPKGTTVIVHAGTCAAIDPAPVGLLGDLGGASQLSTVIPVAFATVADGRHVVAFHPGLDLATVLGCGQVPLVTTAIASGDPGAGAAPTPVPTLVSTPAPTPTADGGCGGMGVWVPATLARIDQLKRLADAAASAAKSGMDAYARQLATNSAAVQQLRSEQQQASAPAPVVAVQADLLTMYQKLADAYDLLSRAYNTGDADLLQEGLGKASESESLSASSRRALRDAATPCGITVPSA